MKAACFRQGSPPTLVDCSKSASINFSVPFGTASPQDPHLANNNIPGDCAGGPGDFEVGGTIEDERNFIQCGSRHSQSANRHLN